MITGEREHKESDLAARLEAKSILQAMKNGIDMTEELHTRPNTLRSLHLFCKRHPGDAYIVRNAIDHRERVRSYVDRLIAGEDLVSSHVTEECEAEAQHEAF